MSSPGRLTGALLVAAVVAGVAAEPAAAKVTFAGIGDVRLNMSQSAVTDTLGQPSKAEQYRGQEAIRLIYRRHKLAVIVQRSEDRVIGVTTTARGQRTSTGLGVGSSARDVKAKLRGEKCSAAQDTLVCTVERAGRILDFEIRRGKVFRVGLSELG